MLKVSGGALLVLVAAMVCGASATSAQNPQQQLWDNTSRLVCENPQMTPDQRVAVLNGALREAGDNGFEVVEVAPVPREYGAAGMRSCVLVVLKRPRS